MAGLLTADPILPAPVRALPSIPDTNSGIVSSMLIEGGDLIGVVRNGWFNSEGTGGVVEEDGEIGETELGGGGDPVANIACGFPLTTPLRRLWG